MASADDLFAAAFINRNCVCIAVEQMDGTDQPLRRGVHFHIVQAVYNGKIVCKTPFLAVYQACHLQGDGVAKGDMVAVDMGVAAVCRII